MVAYFYHETYSNEKERPARGINMEECHTHNVRGKILHTYKSMLPFIQSSKYMQNSLRVLEGKRVATSEEGLGLARS